MKPIKKILNPRPRFHLGHKTIAVKALVGAREAKATAATKAALTKAAKVATEAALTEAAMVATEAALTEAAAMAAMMMPGQLNEVRMRAQSFVPCMSFFSLSFQPFLQVSCTM